MGWDWWLCAAGFTVSFWSGCLLIGMRLQLRRELREGVSSEPERV